MKIDDMVSLCHLADQMEYSAEWRRRKAEEYPEDAQRNLRGAELLEKLSKEVSLLDGSDLHRAYHAAFEEYMDQFGEVESLMIREVGFYSWPESGKEFVEKFIERVQHGY